MKIKGIVGAMVLLLFTLSVSAQVVSKDSISTLKDQKQALELSKKLNDRKLELAKMENELAGKTEEASKAAENAQQSAEDNKKAAEKLGDDAQDKKLARRASKSAGFCTQGRQKSQKSGG
jgi:septal ring factor EnvC (AmiA/AmiB activator)